MAIKVRGEKDFYIGVLYLALGAAGLWFGQTYPFGTPARMGAGFFPVIIAGLLVIFGLVAICRGLAVDGPEVGPIDFKGIALITASVVAFGLLLRPAGLIVAIVISGLIAASANDRFKLGWQALLGLFAFAACCALVFVTGLGLPISIFGTAFAGLYR
ncbi:tripartite tricarboxylate transporter TctB family protein [Devosia aurantiaca]|uniref:Tripartite tricarboxylate transporter TctB family protein n=1 Tax=Devosia aurantiaca TaxID=2714858 RepID=A0A6M1SPU6_9HYPH|nr:tripartite tricarboxylate transporter TctB family protein [Devosia aurantiaca]NGP16493.1 tripartite tricarboxylate transporter TctB family protein [Devosia aurantiaca]